MNDGFTQEQITQILTMYKNETTIDELITKFDIEERQLREILKDTQTDRHYNIWSDELYERAEKLYRDGKTLKEIGEILLVSENGLGKALKKKEVAKRTYSEANRRYKRNSHYFDNIDTPNKAYVLGLIYADGNNYIYRDKHCLTISLQESDRDLLERIRHELEYEGPIRFVPLHEKNERYQNQYLLAITDDVICEQIKKIGVVQKKSLVLKFPTFLRPDLIRHFVRGYFDGDGNIYRVAKSGKWVSSLTSTLEFCTAVQNLLNSMFVKNSIYHPNQSGDNNTYTVKTAANTSTYKFLSWIYRDCDIRMERKYNKYLELCAEYTNPKGRVKSL